MSPAKRVTFLDEVFYARAFRCAHSQELSLHIEMAVEFEVGFVDEDGSVCRLVE